MLRRPSPVIQLRRARPRGAVASPRSFVPRKRQSGPHFCHRSCYYCAGKPAPACTICETHLTLYAYEFSQNGPGRPRRSLPRTASWPRGPAVTSARPMRCRGSLGMLIHVVVPLVIASASPARHLGAHWPKARYALLYTRSRDDFPSHPRRGQCVRDNDIAHRAEPRRPWPGVTELPFHRSPSSRIHPNDGGPAPVPVARSS